jgi:hypothetical protein
MGKTQGQKPKFKKTVRGLGYSSVAEFLFNMLGVGREDFCFIFPLSEDYSLSPLPSFLQSLEVQ